MAEDILGEFKFEGYKQPSAYSMGKGAFETAVKSVGFDDLGAFNKYLADRGIGRVGKDPKGTLELNRLRIEAGLEPYRKIPLVQAAAEKEAFGDDTKKTRPQRAGQMNVGFKAISDAAEKIDGDENKLRFIIDQITERFPQLAKATVINLARTIFMGAGPSLLGADFMSSEATKQMRDELFGSQEQMSFAEGGIATMKAGGGIMDINDMLKPVGYKEGPPKGMAVGDMEKMGEALIRQAMMDAEKKRLEDYDPKDPETFSESTYGTITDDIRLKVALQIARSQGDTSSENINNILKVLENIGGSVSKEETVSIGKNREELKNIVEDMIPIKGIGGDLLRGIASGIGMPIMGGKKMMEDISELINKKKTD